MEQKLCATPNAFFKTNFRNIFKDTKITHTTGKEAKNGWPAQI